jgi:hypothetical protein
MGAGASTTAVTAASDSWLTALADLNREAQAADHSPEQAGSLASRLGVLQAAAMAASKDRSGDAAPSAPAPADAAPAGTLSLMSPKDLLAALATLTTEAQAVPLAQQSAAQLHVLAARLSELQACARALVHGKDAAVAADTRRDRPLGISWYELEKWRSGKGVRDASTDTALSCSLSDELCARYGSELKSADDLARLSDDLLASLCTELDLVAAGPARADHVAALTAPVVSTADVRRFVILPKTVEQRSSYVSVLKDERVVDSVWGKSVPSVAPATHFVSHTWSTPFDDLLSALDEFMIGVPLDAKASAAHTPFELIVDA